MRHLFTKCTKDNGSSQETLFIDELKPIRIWKPEMKTNGFYKLFGSKLSKKYGSHQMAGKCIKKWIGYIL